MRVQPDTVVTIQVSINIDGAPSQPPRTLSLIYGRERLLFDLDRRLQGLAPEETATVDLKPFGEPQPDLIRQIPAAALRNPPDFVPGQSYECQTTDGDTAAFRFLGRDGDLLTCDFNHPNAGRTMTISARVVEVRSATPQELASAPRCSTSG